MPVKKRTAYTLFGCASASGVVAALLLGTLAVGLLFVPSMLFQRSLRAALGTLTAGEATFGSLSLREDGATMRDFALTHPSGTLVLGLDEVSVRCDPSTWASSAWVLEEVRVRGVHLQLDEADGALVLPPGTWSLMWGGDDSGLAPSVAIGSLVVEDVDFVGTGQRGQLRGSVDRLEFEGVAIAPGDARPLSFRAARVEVLTSTVDGRRLLDLASVALPEDGVVSAEGLDGAFALQASGWPVWPPVVDVFVPRWAGGLAASEGTYTDGPWWGLDPSVWPWIPSQGSVRGRVVATDGFVASRPATWVLSGFRANVGPLDGRLPFSIRAGTAGGFLAVDGSIAPDGRIGSRVTAKKMEAAAFAPYLAVDLNRLGVEIREGTFEATTDVVLRGSALTASSDVRLHNVRFNRTSAFSGLNKALLTSASWLLGGNDRTFVAQVSVAGSYDDPGFSPFRQLLGQVSAAIVKDAGQRASKGASTVKETAGKLWRKVFR